jgi:hypothetical protein
LRPPPPSIRGPTHREGFNDPTPFTPIGGNTARRLSARLKVLRKERASGGALLTNNIVIKVEAVRPAELWRHLGRTVVSPTVGYRSLGSAPT